MNTVEKRRQARRNKFFVLFDRKVAEGRLSDVIDSTLGYALTYYHTVDGNMYKEWMNEKRTKKDFRLKNDDDNILWVRLPDGKSEVEVEPINLICDETDKFNEVAKKYILNGMREYNQCFITIMAYNLIWAHASEAKILNLTDDRLGHLRITYRRLVEGLPEMVQKCRGKTGNRRKRFCVRWLDRFPCRDVPTTDIRGLQTSYTFHPWTNGSQPLYR